MRLRALTPIAVLVIHLAGCAGLGPAERADVRISREAGMESRLVEGAGFSHLVYLRGDVSGAGPVHVYLEGDGLPWRTRYRIASDPTPRDPLALKLMAQDPAPSVYLGRPCYYGHSRDPGCGPGLWTHGRYSEPVVATMVAALDRLFDGAEAPDIVLIGYSGGGVLAALMASRLARVAEVVTVAANLDIDAWADHQGYSRLAGSLNPSDRPPLSDAIRQVHFVGLEDRSVPRETTRRFLDRNLGAEVHVEPAFDHRCCWVEHWPRLLSVLDGEVSAPRRASRRSPSTGRALARSRSTPL